MTFIQRSILIIVMCVCLSAKTQAGNFITDLYDIPKMDGMYELPDHTSTFDTPAGRIIEVAVLMPEGSSDTQILNFYDQTLPQMGWVNVGTGVYRREGEVLSLFFEMHGDGSRALIYKVFFVLRPEK